jgi:SSS family solute:Na+ symporter
MQSIDWILLACPILMVIGFAAYTRRFVKGVADYVAGGRCAGRYLICNAKGEASSGVTNTVSNFQNYLVSGFVGLWWDSITVPVILLFAVSGFVVYRYRQTRAMTLGQFFEMRYSRSFRLFAGILGFLSGLLNYGIFPAVSSQFFVYFMGLPERVTLLQVSVPTFALIMGAYLIFAAWMMTVGGQITLLVTDCVEGILSHLGYLVVVAAIFTTISWAEIRSSITTMAAGHSMVNPFDNQRELGTASFFFMKMALTVYTTMAMQKDNGFSTAAKSPHESRMGVTLGHWRTFSRVLMLTVIGIAVFTYTHHPDFHGATDQVHQAVSSITDPNIRDQMFTPVALRYLLPAGIKGLFCAIMVLGLMAGDASHLLTWGSVCIQDIVLPIRGGRPLSPRQHIIILRCAVAGVAVFGFVFSLIWPLTQAITFWWDVTQAVFTGGAGAAIIGGLYWKKGTTSGAWTAVIVGSILATVGIIGRRYSPYFPNGRQVAFYSGCIAVAVYVIVSLLTCRANVDMDRLLHRGLHAEDPTAVKRADTRSRFARFLDITTDFTRMDKVIVIGLFAWSIFWLAVTVAGTIWYKMVPWSNHAWASYWFATGIILPVIVSILTLIWFGIGGIRDIRDFFLALSRMKRDARDDGTVRHPPPQEEPTQGFPVLPPGQTSTVSEPTHA